MNIPGVGEVKNSYLMIGGGLFFGTLGYAYYRKHKENQVNAAAANTGSTTDTTLAVGSVDPETGLPYADEMGSYGEYGGIDPQTGVPYAYEDYNTYGNTTTNGSTITTNEEWITQAEQDGQVLFGATLTLVQSAVQLYLAQSPQGLDSSQYLLMQSIVGELGQPPQGGPYRLIQAQSSTSTGGNPGSNPGSGGNPPSNPKTNPPGVSTGGSTSPSNGTSYRWVTVAAWPSQDSSYNGIASHYGFKGTGNQLWEFQYSQTALAHGRSGSAANELKAQGPNMLHVGQSVLVPIG